MSTPNVLMDNHSRSKLAQLLIAKSVTEALLVGALAVGIFFVAFPSSFQGWGEATPNAIAGWVVNQRQPWQRVEVQLFIDDSFVAAGTASRSRPDVVAAGRAIDEWHGYSFYIPTLIPGNHTARIYAIHSSASEARKTLQLVGDPIPFSLDADGKAQWIPFNSKSWFDSR